MVTTSPCRGCEQRHIGCHELCNTFTKWKAAQLKIYELKRQERLKTGPSAATVKRHDAWVRGHK